LGLNKLNNISVETSGEILSHKKNATVKNTVIIPIDYFSKQEQ